MAIDPSIVYYLWAVLLVLANAIAWATNLLLIPGNWLIVGFTALFAFLVPAEDGRGIGWLTVGIVLALAALGEVVEFAAGAAGAAGQGASRRSIVLTIVGTLVGSIAGAAVGLPVPVIGSILGAVGGGALGAFIGAYAGEIWKGRTSDDSLAAGRGALVGRLVGTVAKLIVGGVMFVVVAVDAFFG